MKRTINARYHHCKNIIEILQQRAIHHPNQVAFTFLENSVEVQSITFKELDNLARAIAHQLQKKARPGDRALLLYKPGIEYIAGFFGCLYAGLIAVPAYPPDPKRLSRMMPRLLGIVKDCRPKFILTTSDIHWKLKMLCLSSPSLLLKSWVSTDLIKPSSQSAEFLNPEFPDIAFLQYTSGSTGAPKGVMVSHQNLIHNSESAYRWTQVHEGEHMLSWLPLYHDMGLIGIVIQTVYVGLSAWVMSPFDFLKNPYNWLLSISKYRISITGGPNFAYQLCTERVTDEQKKSLDLSSLKVMFSGAEPIQSETIQKFSQRFADAKLPHRCLYTCYGLAEHTLIVTGSHHRVQKLIEKDVDFDSIKLGHAQEGRNDRKSLHYVSSGTNVIEDTTIKIVNPETGIECQNGYTGEVWVSSQSVALGYWEKPELSEKIFRAQIPGDNRQYLRTGDLAFCDSNGEFFITGRIKDLIIVNGQNHYPSDLEQSALSASAALREGCLAAFSISSHGTEDVFLVAELKRTFELKNIENARKEIRKAIFNKHDLKTKEIIFIEHGSIPKTTSGKIQRNATKLAYIEGRLKIIGSPTSQEKLVLNQPKQISVKDETELELIQILAAELKVSPSDIHASTELSELGINSIQAATLAHQISERFRIDFSPALFWNYKNISALVRYLTKNKNSSEASPQLPPKTDAKTINMSDIAVVGLSLRFPDAKNPEQFWRNLENGIDSIKNERGRWGGYIRGLDEFDPLFFGISPREAEMMDPQQRLLLQVSWEAIERSGIAPSQLSGTKTGVFMGVSSQDYLNLIRTENIPFDLQVATGNSNSIVANRISFLLNLKGPSLSIDTACSSSLVAVHEAFRSLQLGECETAIAGGVNVILDSSITDTFAEAGMLSPDGRCFTFDQRANGYVRGEGCGVIVLKKLNEALKQGQPILAIIRGSAIEHNGSTNSLTAPNAESQAQLIQKLYHEVGIQPQSIGYFEAHGTATKLGDPIELLGLQRVFDEFPSSPSSTPQNPSLVGSVKTNIGHLEAAAGIAGLIKAVLALNNKNLPPSLHFKNMNSSVRINNKNLRICDRLQEWPSAPLKRAAVSSFGFGGMNAHVVVEEYKMPHSSTADPKNPQIFLFSAKNLENLHELVEKWLEFLPLSTDSMQSLAWTTQCARDAMSHRLAIVAENKETLVNSLRNFAQKNSHSYHYSTVKKGIQQEGLATDLNEIAKLWCEGHSFSWKKLHPSPPPLVIIPTSPFLKMKFWIKNSKRKKHLVHFDFDSFFIRDHLVVDKNILPAVGHLEFVRKAAQELHRKNVSSFTEVTWRNPLVVNTQGTDVAIQLTDLKNGHYQFEILREGENPLIYSQGTVSLTSDDSVSHAKPIVADLPALTEFTEIPDIYSRFADLGLNYGPSFRCMKKVYGRPKDSLIQLDFSQAETANEDFYLHPSLMDAALGACVGIQEISQQTKKSVYIPFSLSKFEIFKPVNGPCWAHAKLSKITSSSDVKSYDVTIFNDNKEVLARFIGVVVREVVLQERQILKLQSKQVPFDLEKAIEDRTTGYVFINFSEDKFEQLKILMNEKKVRRIQTFYKDNDLSHLISEVQYFLRRAEDSCTVVVNLEHGSPSESLVNFMRLYQSFLKNPFPSNRVRIIAIRHQTSSLESTLQASVRGFINTHKFSKPRTRLVNFDSETYLSENFPSQLAEEIQADPSHEVFYSKGKRYRDELVPVGPSALKSRLRKKGNYILSGGAGQLGQKIAQHLVEHWQAHVYILSRSASAQKSTENLTYIACDLTSKNQLEQALKQVKEKVKDVHGIIHAAGQANEKQLDEIDSHQFYQTGAAKIQGCINLDEATADWPLDFFVVTSSISSLLGDFGAGDYASANAFLDEFIQYRQALVTQKKRSGFSLSQNWPLWASGGMMLPLKEKSIYTSMGMSPLPTDLGLSEFESSLSSNLTQVFYFYGDARKIQQSLAPSSKKQELKTVTQDISNQIFETLSALLKIEKSKIDIDADFTEYGMDSMLMMDFVSQLNSLYGHLVTPNMLFENRNVRSLALAVSELLKQKVTTDSQRPASLNHSPSLKSQGPTSSSLSQSQQAMWFVYELDPSSHAYNIPVRLQINKTVDARRVKRALELLVQEQPVLRTIFRKGEELTQVVLENCGVNFREVLEPEDENRIIQEEVRRPFHLTEEPGFRTLLISKGPENHQLILTAHHIVFDGLSVFLILKKFINLYQDLENSHALKHIEVDWTYFEFIEQQKQFLRSLEAAKQFYFWQEHLSGQLPILQLPSEKPRPVFQTYNGSTVRLNLASDVSQRLRECSKNQKVTLNSILLSAFYVFLKKYCNQSDFVVGLPMVGRNSLQTSTLGYFVNMLPLRQKLKNDQKLIELVQSVNKDVAQALLNYQYPFPLIVEKLHPKRDTSRSPIFQSAFVFQNMLKDELFQNSEILRPFQYSHISQQEGQFDLELEVLDWDDSLTFHFKYNTDLFSEPTVKQWVKSYEHILKSFSNQLTTTLDQVSSMDSSTVDYILRGLNSTEYNYDNNLCLHQLIEKQVSNSPDKIAVIYENQNLTYSELNRRSNQLAHYLRSQGVGPKMFVGVYMERSLEMVISLLAILKSGAAYVPVEPTYPEKRIKFIYSDSQFAMTLTQEKWASNVSKNNSKFFCVDTQWHEISDLDDQNLPLNTDLDDLTYMIYTSGSTGEPKGAMNTHRGVINRLLWSQRSYGIKTDDVVLQKTPFSFDVSVPEFFTPLMFGAQLVVLEPEAHKDPLAVLEIIETKKISLIHFVPSMLRIFLDMPDLNRRCESLRVVLASGEALSVDTQDLFFQRLSCELHNLYGPTEASVEVTHWKCEPNSKYNFVPIGRPIDNIKIYILDSQKQPVPIGVSGELYISGVGVAKGYFHRDELTAERFLLDPFDKSGKTRMYRTGDLARYDQDGVIEYLGRIDNQVKIRGFRIELGEIENTLDQHPMIKSSVVVTYPLRQGEPELVAYYVQKSKSPLATSDLRQYLAQTLPEIMIPSVFMNLEQLPLSANGKVDRKLLPPPAPPTESATPTQPRNEVESKMMTIWSRILGNSALGLQDNFFEKGGNSLLSIRLIHEVNKAFGAQIRVRDFYEFPTIESLSAKMMSPHTNNNMTAFLEKEASLEKSIQFKSGFAENTKDKIFLTGATGFLGAYLLRDLIEGNNDSKILCLVRSDDDFSGKLRIIQNMKKYGIWKSEYEKRFDPILGDLKEFHLGISRFQWSYLAENISKVYHCAARVNFIEPYSYLKKENIDGTLNVLRLCSEIRTKPLHYVSTISVFDSFAYDQSDRLGESSPLQAHGLLTGYAQTKWVAEKLVEEARGRGLPATIYRPGTVTGDSLTGLSNSDDLFYRLLQATTQLRCIPDINFGFDVVPVDTASKAIIRLSERSESINANFHLIGPRRIYLKELGQLFNSLDYHIGLKKYDEWVQVLLTTPGHSLQELLPLFTEIVPGTEKTQAQLGATKPLLTALHTEEKLRHLNLPNPPLTRELLALYLAPLEKTQKKVA